MYAITLDSPEYTDVDAEGAVQIVEPQLRASILDILECDAPANRKLASDYGIVGVDYFPPDAEEEEGKQSNSNHFYFESNRVLTHRLCYTVTHPCVHGRWLTVRTR